MNRSVIDRRRLRDAAGREGILTILEAGLSAVDPAALVANALRREKSALAAGGRVFGVAIGKASLAMAGAAEEALGARFEAGVAVAPQGGGGAWTDRWDVVLGGHPLPDEGSVAAAEAIERLAGRVGDGDVVVCLLSGGGSALAASPPPGLTLDDLRGTTRLLLEGGVPIDEMNLVRRHLTTLGGGGLARRLAPARIVTLALSDVVGSRPESIASGPTVPDPTTFRDARDVLASRGLWDAAAAAVRERIEQGIRREVEETAKPGDPIFARSAFHLLADGSVALSAAAGEAERRGWRVVRSDGPITGEARAVGRQLGRKLVAWTKAVDVSTLWLGAGETTVTVRGGGRGGRNQEVALAAALEMAGIPGVGVGCLATDGVDGPTDAAGAVVDGETAARGGTAGLTAIEALDDNDSYSYLSASRDLLFTGPTGTNVADLLAGWVARR